MDYKHTYNTNPWRVIVQVTILQCELYKWIRGLQHVMTTGL